MVLFTLRTLLPSLCVLFSLRSSLAVQTGTSDFWFADIERQGQAPFNPDKGYKIFRNVKDYGARGDGSTDDTEAINTAVSDMKRCGEGCDSSTVAPAIIYFPPGIYIVKEPIVQYYYTQFIGNAKQLPTLKASASFEGIGLIDANPYVPGGTNWYTNQNNFYRQIRNFVIDISAAKVAAGIHWQVSQATSLQNVVFNMAEGEEGAQQKGILQENGSGGFMTDLVFNGGAVGAFLGSQQYTTRNLTFNNCGTGIYMSWNWLWTIKSATFNNCKVGIDMANAPSNQTVGSVILLDSKTVNTPIGINMSFSEKSIPITGGTLILDNVDFAGSKTAAVQNFAGDVILPGGKKVEAWAQGHVLTADSQQRRHQGDWNGLPAKPVLLMGKNGFFERSKPQYEHVDVKQFISVKSHGAKGNGATDDTKAIQAAINSLHEEGGGDCLNLFLALGQGKWLMGWR